MRARADIEGQLGAFLEMMPDQALRVLRFQADALVAVAHVERRRLPGALDQPRERRAGVVRQVERLAIQETEPQRRRTEPELTVRTAMHVAEPGERTR